MSYLFSTYLLVLYLMTWYAFFGALEQGFAYGLMVLGVYLTFRVLDFPDLTVDGSLPLGAAVSAVAITAGVHPIYPWCWRLVRDSSREW